MVTRLTYLGFLSISGPDAQEFLQGQLTCDVKELTTSKSLLGVCCNRKGRVISQFRILLRNEDYLLILPADTIELTLNHFKKYALFSKVEFNNITEEMGCLGFQSENLTSYLKNIPINQNEVCINDSFTAINVNSKTHRYLAFGKVTDIEILYDKLSQHLSAKTESEWQRENCREGLAEITPKTSEQFTPHMLNYDLIHAINFNKGCYIGQEIVARSHYLGNQKKRLRFFSIQAEKETYPGEIVYDKEQNAIGFVVNTYQVSQNHYEILATINLETEPAF